MLGFVMVLNGGAGASEEGHGVGNAITGHVVKGVADAGGVGENEAIHARGVHTEGVEVDPCAGFEDDADEVNIVIGGEGGINPVVHGGFLGHHGACGVSADGDFFEIGELRGHAHEDGVLNGEGGCGVEPWVIGCGVAEQSDAPAVGSPEGAGGEAAAALEGVDAVLFEVLRCAGEDAGVPADGDGGGEAVDAHADVGAGAVLEQDADVNGVGIFTPGAVAGEGNESGVTLSSELELSAVEGGGDLGAGALEQAEDEQSGSVEQGEAGGGIHATSESGVWSLESGGTATAAT